VGASRPAQLDDNAAASGLVIDPALFAKAEAIVAAIRIAALGLALQLAFCFEMRALSDRLVSSAPE